MIDVKCEMQLKKIETLHFNILVGASAQGAKLINEILRDLTHDEVCWNDIRDLLLERAPSFEPEDSDYQLDFAYDKLDIYITFYEKSRKYYIDYTGLLQSS